MKYILIPILALLSGCATDQTTGQQTLDPQIKNALIDVARGAVSGLEAGAAKSGTVNWKDAAQGALAQVYSTESTDAINKAVGYSGLSPAYQASVTTAVNTVVATAQQKGLNEQNAILIGTTFLDNALQASKASP